MTRHAFVFSYLSALPVVVLSLALAGCCTCPAKVSGGKQEPCPGKAAVSKSGPKVLKGTPAPAVADAPDGWVAAPGVTVTSQPGEAAWAAYSAAGYRTIVNFRPVSEGADREREMVVANGMQYFNLPVDGPAVTLGDAEALAKILDGSANRQVLLHCSSGARASGVWALYQARYHGLSTDAAIAEGQRVGPMKDSVQQRVRALLDGTLPDCKKDPDCPKRRRAAAN